jgi:hypothetical protein
MTLLHANATAVAIEHAATGDVVLSASAEGQLSNSAIVAVPHAKNAMEAIFVVLSTAEGELILTPDHLVPVHARCTVAPGTLTSWLVRAREAAVGDCLMRADNGGVMRAVEIRSIRRERLQGLYTVVTEQPFLVVNGFVASPFARSHDVPNAFFDLHRYVFRTAPSLLDSAPLHAATEAARVAANVFME